MITTDEIAKAKNGLKEKLGSKGDGGINVIRLILKEKPAQKPPALQFLTDIEYSVLLEIADRYEIVTSYGGTIQREHLYD